MPIAIEKDDQTIKLEEEPFGDEGELQACLERSPYLLVSDQEPRVVAVQREVRLPAAGILDLLLVDSEGVPVAVEVKLGRNSQSRREVVAQAFDYVSDLTQLTVDELDDAVGGRLIEALEELSAAGDATELRKQCGTNLRAGRIKVIVAVDEPNDGVVRIVRYINDHSDLDVRLVAVSKFNEGKLLVPRLLVSGGPGTTPQSRRLASERHSDPAFEAVVAAYDSTAPQQLQTENRGRRYRRVLVGTWPDALHYEFFDHDDQVGIELHLESDEVRPLASLLSTFAGKEILPGVVLEWDPTYFAKRGKLFAKTGKQNLERAAQMMGSLINMTRPAIDRELIAQRSRGE